MEVTEATLLIVEDEKEKREFLFRTLTGSGIPAQQIQRASYAKKAQELIWEFEPNIVLLDIKIPKEENDIIAEPENVRDVLDKIRLFNHENVQKIKTIIISGTVKHKVVQEMIGSLNKQTVFDFIDKIEIATNPEEFKQRLIKKISKALNTEFAPEKIDYTFIRKSKIKELKKLHEPLWNQIKEEVIDEFERFNDKNVNEHPTAKGIVRTCGEIVEIIINLFKNKSIELSKIVISNDLKSIREQLNALSGRKYLYDENIFKMITKKPLISRKACHYAYQAYYIRSHASHPPESDKKNENIFKDIRFSKEDAAISLNLIVPLILDFINFIKNK